MESHFTANKTIRNNFKQLINSLSNELLVQIPAGFKNHILWNFGHAIVTQNILCYKLSGNAFTIDEAIIERYKKGSKPSQITDIESERQLLLKLADETVEQLSKDIAEKDFINFTSYETSFGITLHTIEDAILFNNVHEGLHLGYAMAQRKALGK